MEESGYWLERLVSQAQLQNKLLTLWGQGEDKGHNTMANYDMTYLAMPQRIGLAEA